MQVSERGSWTGHAGFILAAAGSAIGLGNIWRFPYATGQNGGGAFVLVYLAAVALVGLPILVAEVVIGRSAQRNPVGAFRMLGGPKWPWVGYAGVIAGFVILSYYAVVAGWAFDYMIMSVRGELGGLDTAGMQTLFGDFLASVPRQLFWQALFMIATIVVVSYGIEAGIERASKVLMPLLFGFLLLLLGYALTSERAAEGLSFLLRPRFSELSWNGALAALGQAFFSLSLGMGAMITYGSYLEQKRNVARAGLLIVIMDTAVAVLAGLVIFPLVYSYGLNPAEGPSLVFVVLPEAFVRMPATTLLATVFFALLLFAALTSAISLLEVVVSFVCDELGWNRIAAAWAAGALIYALGVPSVVVGGFLDWADWLASSIMLPVGGFFIALFVGWWLPVDQLESAYAGQEDHSGGFRSWRLCIRYLAPVAVGVILLQKIWIPN